MNLPETTYIVEWRFKAETSRWREMEETRNWGPIYNIAEAKDAVERAVAEDAKNQNDCEYRILSRVETVIFAT